MQQLRSRLGWTGLGLACLALMACDNKGQERNFNRLDAYSDIVSTAAVRAPADITGISGTATYRGTGFGEFPAESRPPPEDPGDPDSAPLARTYTATSDVELVADFTGGTLSGEMTGWTPEDSGNFDMRGIVRISDGRIRRDGSFDAVVSGSVERRMTARRLREIQETGEEFDLPEDYLVGVVAGAEGQIYDSVTGERASHIIGTIEGPNMTGGFAARQ